MHLKLNRLSQGRSDRAPLAAISLSESVFTLRDFHRMTADADIRDLVAMFFSAGINMTGAPHLYALLNVQGLRRLLQSISYQPGDGATRCRPRGRILTQGINATSAQPNHCIARIAGHVEEV